MTAPFCGNGAVNRIFREESGFKGFNTSDWGGTHGTLYINIGLDLEKPGGTFFAPVAGQSGRGAGAPGAAAGAAAGRGGQGAAAGQAGAAAANPGGMAAANPGGIQGGFPGMAAGMPEEQATGARSGGGGGARGGDPPPIGMLEAVRTGQVIVSHLRPVNRRI